MKITKKNKLIIGAIIVVFFIIFALELGTLLFWKLNGGDNLFLTVITPATSPLGIICILFPSSDTPPGWRRVNSCWWEVIIP